MGMKTIRYVHWQDGNMWLGYLEALPGSWGDFVLAET